MSVPAEVLAHYEKGAERTRLTQGNGRLELWRTQDILTRHLPPPPARVLDVGGGPGVYAEWLTSLGYQVMWSTRSRCTSSRQRRCRG